MAVGVGKHVVLSSFLFLRYLKKKLENGKRNGLQLTGDELEEFKLVKKKIYQSWASLSCCALNHRLNYQNHHTVVTILPQVLYK